MLTVLHPANEGYCIVHISILMTVKLQTERLWSKDPQALRKISIWWPSLTAGHRAPYAGQFYWISSPKYNKVKLNWWRYNNGEWNSIRYIFVWALDRFDHIRVMIVSQSVSNLQMEVHGLFTVKKYTWTLLLGIYRHYFFPFFNDVNLLKFCQNGDCPDLETWNSTTSDCCVSSESRKGPWDEGSDGETHLLWLKPAQHKVKRQRQEMFEKLQKCSQWEENVNAQSIIKIINAQRWWIMLHNIQYSL